MDIGSASIKMVYGTRILGKTEIKGFGILPTPKLSYENGYLKELEVIIQETKEFIKNKRIKPDSISFVIHSTDILIRNFNLPVMSKANIRATVEWEMEKFLNGSVKDYYISFEIINKKDRNYEILGVMVPKVIIDQYGVLSQYLGVKIKYVDIAAKCALRYYRENNGEFVIMDLGHRSARISLYSNNKIFVDRELVYDMSMWNREVTQQKVDVNNIIKNFEQIISYYLSIDREKRINSIHLIGGGSNSEIIRNYLLQNFGAGMVNFSDKAISANKGFGNIFKEDTRLYVNSIGLLLRK